MHAPETVRPGDIMPVSLRWASISLSGAIQSPRLIYGAKIKHPEHESSRMRPRLAALDMIMQRNDSSWRPPNVVWPWCTLTYFSWSKWWRQKMSRECTNTVQGFKWLIWARTLTGNFACSLRAVSMAVSPFSPLLPPLPPGCALFRLLSTHAFLTNCGMRRMRTFARGTPWAASKGPWFQRSKFFWEGQYWSTMLICWASPLVSCRRLMRYKALKTCSTNVDEQNSALKTLSKWFAQKVLYWRSFLNFNHRNCFILGSSSHLKGTWASKLTCT